MWPGSLDRLSLAGGRAYLASTAGRDDNAGKDIATAATVTLMPLPHRCHRCRSRVATALKTVAVDIPSYTVTGSSQEWLGGTDRECRCTTGLEYQANLFSGGFKCCC